MSNRDEERIEMLTQPLTTEDGYLNEACVKELEAAINNMPESYERLANDPEWQATGWIGAYEITGLLSKWAIQQSAGVPPAMDDVLNYCLVCLRRDDRFSEWQGLGHYAKLSLCDINKLLWDILGELQLFLDWNEKGIMKPLGLEWIDLSALLHNVCISIRNERRHDRAFNEEFEREYGSQ